MQDMTLVYGGEIEVRGSPLLVGQAKALNRQKNAINISNIVAADQIGRFPDKNASEATPAHPRRQPAARPGRGPLRHDPRHRGRGSTRPPSTASASRPRKSGQSQRRPRHHSGGSPAIHRGLEGPDARHGRRLDRRHRRSRHPARAPEERASRRCPRSDLHRTDGGNSTDRPAHLRHALR